MTHRGVYRRDPPWQPYRLQRQLAPSAPPATPVEGDITSTLPSLSTHATGTVVLPAGVAIPNVIPDLIVELGLLPAGEYDQYLQLGDPTRGLLGVGRLGAASELWTNVSDYLDFGAGRTITITAGKNDPLGHFDAGTCSVPLQNDDGRFDPNNLDGPYVSGGISLIRPMCRIRIRAVNTTTGDESKLFRGFVDEFVPDLRTPNNPSRVVKARDALKLLATLDPLESAPVGAGENSGARINRLLDLAAIPDGERAVDVGNSTLQATTLAQNLLTEAYLTADSEFGDLFDDPSTFKLTFKNRRSIISEARSRIPQWTFDIGDPDALPFTSLQPSDDDKLVRNLVQVAREGGELVMLEDEESQAIYGPRTFNRRDLLLETDDDVAVYAERIRYLYGEHEYRFEELVIDPYLDDRLWAVVLNARIRDRFTIVERNPNVAPVARDCFVAGFQHTIGARSWVTRYSLVSATKFNGLILGDADYGRLGQATLAAL